MKTARVYKGNPDFGSYEYLVISFDFFCDEKREMEIPFQSINSMNLKNKKSLLILVFFFKQRMGT